jgi:hypothetical protein|mmetsp:Transcript_31867/g.5761  ORF Transcript_31867/g.5761 Transcript_31867/m.5761 type:complete len:101 (-) Transcript_31867:31-333(-)
MGLPEYIPFLSSLPIGALIAYKLTSKLNAMPLLRKRYFSIIWGSAVAFSLLQGIKGSYYKLTGLENNGLQWRYSEENNTKYNFTQELDNSPFYSLFVKKD